MTQEEYKAWWERFLGMFPGVAKRYRSSSTEDRVAYKSAFYHMLVRCRQDDAHAALNRLFADEKEQPRNWDRWGSAVARIVGEIRRERMRAESEARESAEAARDYAELQKRAAETPAETAERVERWRRIRRENDRRHAERRRRAAEASEPRPIRELVDAEGERTVHPEPPKPAKPEPSGETRVSYPEPTEPPPRRKSLMDMGDVPF